MFDTVAPLQRLTELLATVSGIRVVYTGVPKAVDADVAAYVTAGAQELTDKASGGLLQRTASYDVTLVYAVEGDSQQAELAVAAALDAFVLLLYAERAQPDSPLRTLSGIDLTRSTSAEYLSIVGQEYRRYPIVVDVLQQQTIGVA
jgi:hypothetical protein